MESPVVAMNAELQELIRGYNDFQLCLKFGWTIDQLYDQPAEVIERWMGFMQAEHIAEGRAQRDAMRAMKSATATAAMPTPTPTPPTRGGKRGA